MVQLIACILMLLKGSRKLIIIDDSIIANSDTFKRCFTIMDIYLNSDPGEDFPKWLNKINEMRNQDPSLHFETDMLRV